jgi:hypothetical protein
MTYKEAKDLIRARAGSKYRGTKLLLLQKITASFYNPNAPNENIEAVEKSKKVSTILGWISVNDRQLLNILDDIEEIVVLRREDHTLHYKINLQPLKASEKVFERQKREKRERGVKRTAAARAKRAELLAAMEVRTKYDKGVAEMRAFRQPLSTALTAILADKLANGVALTPEQRTKVSAYIAAQKKADEYAELVRQEDSL